jgi:hypothetical protein
VIKKSCLQEMEGEKKTHFGNSILRELVIVSSEMGVHITEQELSNVGGESGVVAVVHHIGISNPVAMNQATEPSASTARS